MSLQLSELSDVESPDQEYLWTLNFGPQHPATHTTLRLVLKLDGETIVDAVPDIGYLHSGFEKLGEDLDFNQYVTIVDRMNYISPVANEIAWHHAVEKLVGVEITPRCKYVRTIFAELMRIHDHLLCVGAAALDLGAFTPFLYAFKQREKIYDICEFASGQRFHSSYTRVGGVMYDVDDKWVDPRPRVRGRLPGGAERNEPAADPQPHLHVAAAAASACSAAKTPSTTAARGRSPAPAASSATCGKTSRTLRIPISISRSSAPTAATATPGTWCACRRCSRSNKIIDQAIENLPGGPINVDAEGRAIMPGKQEVYQSIEGLIRHFETIIPNRGFLAPVEEIYAAKRRPTANWATTSSETARSRRIAPARGRRRTSISPSSRT